jgi:hypothetical protein
MIRSNDSGYPVYNRQRGFRVIQVCSFISSLDLDHDLLFMDA